MQQVIEQLLTISINNGEDTPTNPNTGFLGFIDGSGSNTSLILALIITTIVLAVATLILRHKQTHKTLKPLFVSTMSLVALTVTTIITTTTTATTTETKTFTTESTITLPSTATHGYTIKAYMSGSNALTNANQTATLIGTNTASTIDDLTTNSWGIKSNLDNNYQSLPTDQSQATILATSNDTTPAGTQITFPVAAKVNQAIPSGDYTGQVYYQINKHYLYTLNYDQNTTDAVTNLPDPATSNTPESTNTFTISTMTPQRTNYTFKGWSTNASVTTAEYQPGEDYTMTAGETEEATETLYAIWQRDAITFDQAFAAAGKTKVTDPSSGAEYYKMSDMDATICNTVTGPTSATAGDEQTTTLIDIRNNKTYTIAKLADGNCWMTQNLDLELSTTTTLTSDNTDLTNTASWTPTRNTYTTQGTWNADKDNDESARPTAAYYQASYGTYYNWPAATAGSGTSSLTSGEAPNSICPKGWKLPVNDGTTSYKNLIKAYGISSATDSRFTGSPLGVVFAGYFCDGGWMRNQRKAGYLWSSTAYGRSGARRMRSYLDGILYPQDDDIKYDGISVRCVAGV